MAALTQVECSETGDKAGYGQFNGLILSVEIMVGKGNHPLLWP